VGQTRTPSKPAKGKERGGNPISRWYRALALFISQILDELRKVVRPTRNELWNYTLVVIVFVSFMMALVSGLDLGFSKLVALVFGTWGGAHRAPSRPHHPAYREQGRGHPCPTSGPTTPPWRPTTPPRCCPRA
jgi:preprotein translocase subunit SecE